MLVGTVHTNYMGTYIPWSMVNGLNPHVNFKPHDSRETEGASADQSTHVDHWQNRMLDWWVGCVVERSLPDVRKECYFCKTY